MTENLGCGICDRPRGENGMEAKKLIQQEKQANGDGGDRKLAPGNETGKRGALRKLGTEVLEACIGKVVWKKEVLDESDASSDGDKERVWRYEELGHSNNEGESDASIPGCCNCENSDQVEENGAFGSRHLFGVECPQAGSQLLESVVVCVSMVGGDGEGKGGDGAISEGCKATFQLCRISQPAWEGEEQR